MLDLVFTVILAGCGDAGGGCTVLEQAQVPATSVAVCEAALDQRLLQLSAEWPEVAGLCLEPGQQFALPAGWEMPQSQAIAAR